MTAPGGVCPSCGAAMPAAARFCPGCGAGLAQASPPPAASAQDEGGDPLVCPRCGRWMPCPACLCPSCMAGEPVPPKRRRTRFRWWRLLWFVGLGAVALAGRSVLTHSLGTLALLVAMAVLIILLRRTLGTGLRALSGLAVFGPYWAVQSRVPKVLRILGGIAVSVALAFWLTPKLNRVFNGYGFMVFASVLSINTVVAFFIMGRGPQRGSR
ncbi:MAG: zinc ribbon domain-containing protein [Planctomycetota bacterium]